jgi:hypothetical protein
MTDKIFIFILLIHFLADFALQTNNQAIKKSTDIKYLTFHVLVYSMIWLIASWFLLDVFYLALWFMLITFVCHWITDFLTSRIGKPYWDKGDLHNGFIIVGFDQILHYIQLWFTLKWLMSC